MGDAGEPEKPFEVLLLQGDEVPVEHGDRRQDGQEHRQLVIIRRRQRHQPHHHRHAADLGEGGNQTRRFVGRALVNIRRPKLEREQGQLVEKAA